MDNKTDNNYLLVQLPVYLRRDQYERIRDMSFETRRSMADLIREAVDAWLETKDKEG